MDRTLIAPWKAEEKELSERLYKKMQGLILLFTPSDELRKCLSEEMFLKPNQHAFFHVMHFLFRALDSVEFKKRFYWPLSDKRSESIFRTATVEYLKHLSDKHNLQWNIKSYLVVMPGGIKFITFLLDLVALLIKELTVQRERQLTGDIDTDQAIDWNIKRFRIKNELLKHIASKYMADMDELISKYHQNIALIKQELDEIATDTGVSVKELMDPSFHEKFNDANRKLFDMKFRKPTAQLMSLEEPLEALKDIVDKSQSKNSITSCKINIKLLKEAIEAFNKHYLLQDSQPIAEEIRMKSLIDAFNCLHSDVLASLDQSEATDKDYDFLNSELCTLRSEYEELEKQMKVFQQAINASSQKVSHKLKNEQLAVSPFREVYTENNMLKGDEQASMNNLLSKYVSTPPIKMEMMGSERARSYRLPLLDQRNAQIKENSENFLAPLRSTTQKFKHSIADQSLKDLNSTMTRSKIIDPMQLLRTLQKSNSKVKPSTLTNQQRNDSSLSKLASKWKESSSLLIDNKTSTLCEAADVTLKQDIAFTSPAEDPTTHTKLASKSFNSSNCSGAQLHHYSKKLSAVKKVQSASINLNNLSTSPSGRLEPLVKLQLNDATLNDTTLSTTRKSFLQEDDNQENLINITESKYVIRDNSFESEEQLLNISDSVLKDISM